ncbi:MAG: histidinol-phosphate transaminase [Thiolinea sp.]
MYPDISYSFYPVYANLYQVATQVIPLREDFSLDLDDYPADNGGIIFPIRMHPPAGCWGWRRLSSCLQRNTKSVVLVDEAYIDFGGESAISLVQRYPQLLVVQTLSKSRALAGLRVGFAVGQPALIEGLERVKNSFNSYPLGRMELAGATAALRDRAYTAQMCGKIIATREHTTARLQELGFTVLPSAANFLFVRPPAGNAQAVYLALKQQGVLVRYFNKPRINEYLRITIGTDEEMAVLLDKLPTILEANRT